MRSKLLALAGAAVVTALGLSACSSSGTSASQPAGSTGAATGSTGTTGPAAATGSSTASGGTATIGFLATAPRNDNGFTQYALVGVNAAIKKNPAIKLASIVDNVTSSTDQIQGLQTLAAKDSVVVADGASLQNAVQVVAPKFPKVRFILVAAETDSFLANVTSINPDVGYDAIVAGAVAAALSRSKKLGMVSGLQVPASTAWYYGMAQGAPLGAGGAKVSQTYTGDYNDVGKAKQASAAMIDSGVDAILGDLDSGIQGVYQAADAASSPVAVYQVFGLDCSADKNVVGSGIVDWSSILEDAVASAADGSLPAGAVSYGLAKGALSFQFCPGKATPAAKALAAKVTQEIVSGSLMPADHVLLPKPSYAVSER